VAASNERHRNEANAAMSQNSQQSASSTSTHLKREKSKKNDVDHRPVTSSLTSSSGLLYIESGPSHVEQVLATNEG
jgi:hypothetical protein